MRLERFKAIKITFRTDDSLRGDKNNKLAPVLHVWAEMQNNFFANYTAGPYLTIDEQLPHLHVTLWQRCCNVTYLGCGNVAVGRSE